MTEHKFPYPVPKEYDIQKDYYDNGVIPKKDLVDGALYRGTCRNASIAWWDAERNMFKYHRTKFGDTFVDVIEALEDDRGFDVFLPLERVED